MKSGSFLYVMNSQTRSGTECSSTLMRNSSGRRLKSIAPHNHCLAVVELCVVRHVGGNFRRHVYGLVARDLRENVLAQKPH